MVSKSSSDKLKGKIDSAFLEAQKAKDKIRVETFRMLRSEIRNKEIELKEKSLDDENVTKLLKTALKKRREAAELFKKGDREELAEKEEKEAEVIKEFLPEQLSEEVVEKIVKKVIQDTEASGLESMGSVMKAVMAETQGKADGKVVSQLVRKHLSAES